MTHFLWVEDFKASETNREENIVSSTVNLVFGSVLNGEELKQELREEDANDAQDYLEKQGIILKLNLLEALEFIHNPNELAKIDFVVLDVDMPLRRDKQNDDQDYLPGLIKQYKSEDQLKKIAGYQIYTELVIELGFPKKHILFCSNHAEYFDELKNKFSSANIKPPLSSNPEKPFLTKDDDVDIKQWLDDARCDYFVLRRGLIEGCNYLKKYMDENEGNLQLRDFINNEHHEISTTDIHNYLDTLTQFLPLKEPRSPSILNIQYRLFLRALAHMWEENFSAESFKKNQVATLEDKIPIYTFGWIMKMSRNWVSHANLLEPLEPEFIAFLFLINMRAMFKLPTEIQAYETILFKCLSKAPSETIDLERLRINIKDAEGEIDGILRNSSSYKHFGEKINTLYRDNTGNPDSEVHDFKRFLLQYFWVNQKKHTHNLTSTSDHFLPVLAYHIYKFSFPQKGKK